MRRGNIDPVRQAQKSGSGEPSRGQHNELLAVFGPSRQTTLSTRCSPGSQRVPHFENLHSLARNEVQSEPSPVSPKIAESLIAGCGCQKFLVVCILVNGPDEEASEPNLVGELDFFLDGFRVVEGNPLVFVVAAIPGCDWSID